MVGGWWGVVARGVLVGCAADMLTTHIYMNFTFSGPSLLSVGASMAAPVAPPVSDQQPEEEPVAPTDDPGPQQREESPERRRERRFPEPVRVAPADLEGRSARQHRFYAVWRIPGSIITGVVVAREPDAWARLASLLPGGDYLGSGARLCRAYSLEAAICLFIDEPGRLPELGYWLL